MLHLESSFWSHLTMLSLKTKAGTPVNKTQVSNTKTCLNKKWIPVFLITNKKSNYFGQGNKFVKELWNKSRLDFYSNVFFSLCLQQKSIISRDIFFST